MLPQWVISQDTSITSFVSPMRFFSFSLLTSLMTAGGFYVHGNILGGNFVHLCFSHDLSKCASTYLIAYTHEQIIERLKYVADNEPSSPRYHRPVNMMVRCHDGEFVQGGSRSNFFNQRTTTSTLLGSPTV